MYPVLVRGNILWGAQRTDVTVEVHPNNMLDSYIISISAHDSDYMWICGAARRDLPFTSQDGAVMDTTPGIANRAKRRHATGTCAREARMTAQRSDDRWAAGKSAG